MYLSVQSSLQVKVIYTYIYIYVLYIRGWPITDYRMGSDIRLFGIMRIRFLFLFFFIRLLIE